MSVGGNYGEKNNQGSDWASSVTGGNFHTNNHYDPNVTAYTDNLMNRANTASNTPFTGFNMPGSIGGNAVSDLTAFQQTNIGTPTTTAGQLSNTDLSPYMNPYEQTVVDQNAQDIDRTRQMQQQGNASSAVAANAYGGARDALLRSETNRGASDAAARSSATLRYQGFTNAQDRATADIDRTFQSDLGNTNRVQQSALANQQAAMQAAGIRLNAGNSAMNNQYQEFLRQQGSPYANVNFLRDAITGLPLNSSIFGDTSSATNRFGGNEGSSSGWGVNGNASLTGMGGGGGG